MSGLREADKRVREAVELAAELGTCHRFDAGDRAVTLDRYDDATETLTEAGIEAVLSTVYMTPELAAALLMRFGDDPRTVAPDASDMLMPACPGRGPSELR